MASPHYPRRSELPVDQDMDVQRRLERDRARNDQKLKSRFEHIFRKYGHDFTGVGDEIDIESGEVVVNNGHLQHMRDEIDPGQTASPSSRFVRTFQDVLGHEDESMSSDNAEDLSSSEDTDYNSVDMSRKEERRPHGHTLEAFAALSRPVPRLAQLLVGEGTPQPMLGDGPYEDNDDYNILGPSRDNTPAALLSQVPNLRSSIAGIESARASVDPDAIQALGMSIANQLAQLMATSSKKSKKSKQKARMSVGDPMWSYPELGVRSQQKRRRSSSPVSQPPFPPSPVTRTPGYRSLWSAVPSQSKRRRQELYSEPTEAPVRRFGVGVDTPPSKRCWNCSLIRTSSWHHGPHGQDLCASCHQYYDHHGRMKSLDSTTPSIVEHDQSPHDPSSELEEPSHEDIVYDQESTATPTEDSMIDVSQEHIIYGEDSMHHSSVVPPDNGKTKEIGHVEKDHPETQPHYSVQQGSITSYSANTSRPLSSTPVRQRHIKFEVEEDAVIIKLKEQDRLTWEDIGRHLPHRTMFALQQRYSSVLRDQPSEGRDMYHEQYQATELEHDPARNSIWNQEQDERLLKLRQNDRLGWPEIASLLPDHDADAVHKRYSTLVGRAREERERTPVSRYLSTPPEDHGHDTVSRRNALFRPEEDALLVRLKEIDRQSWKEISQRFSGRPLSAIQKRYSSTLTPSKRSTISTRPQDTIEGTIQDRILAVDPSLAGPPTSEFRSEPFQPEEDDMIKTLREFNHLDWDEISTRFDRRPAKLLQNRYAYNCSYKADVLDESIERPEGSREASERSRSTGAAGSMAVVVTRAEQSIPQGEWNQFQSPGREVSSPSFKSKYTAEESQLLGELRARGMPWDKVMEHFPGRTLRGIQSHWSKHSPKPLKGRSSLQAGSGAAGTPLLRQALGNSLRRRSDGEPSMTNRLKVSSRGIRSSLSSEIELDDHVDDFNMDPSLQLSEELYRSYQETPSRPPVHSEGAQKIDDVSLPALQPWPRTGPMVEELGALPVLHDDPVKDPDFVPPMHASERERAAASRGSGRHQRTVVQPDPVIDPRLYETSVNDWTAESHVVIEQDELEQDKRVIGVGDHSKTRYLTQPNYTWAELICAAFTATQSETMTCKDLYAWIERKYEFYRFTQLPWRDNIRAELGGNTMFERAPSVHASRQGEWRSKQTDAEKRDSRDSTLPKHTSNDVQSQNDSNIISVDDALQPPLSDRLPSRHVTFDPQVRVTTPIVSVYHRPKSNTRTSSEPVRALRQGGETSPEIAESDGEDDLVPQGKPGSSKTSRGTPHNPRESNKSGLRGLQISTPANKTPVFSRIHQIKSHSTPRRVRTPIINHRWSSPAPGQSRRVVETPVRVSKDPEEDELTL